MRLLGKAFLALLITTGLFAQYRGGFSGAAPRATGSFGSVVFPGGGPAASGVQRSFGSVVFPGSGGLRVGVPNRTTGVGSPSGSPVRGRSSGVVYAYPVYVGGYYDNSYSQPSEQAAPPGQTIVIYPSAASALPGGNSGPAPGEQSRFRLYQPEPIQAEEDSAPPAEPAQYLLAFKDRTVYSTPAYWVDGDTIHYFSAGNKHNQASVSLIDRALTERLNEESGAEVNLPPEK